MINIPILVKDDTWSEHEDKFKEEVAEVADEIDNLRRKAWTVKEKIEYSENLASEVFDVIQMCVGMLDKLSTDIDIEKANKKHFFKLKGRGWKFKKILLVKVNDKQ
jgi:NTP pyrophosphatase (non-canonical NTP hydrolase)